MVTLLGAFLVTLLVVGTAALSGHPLTVTAIALAVGGAILAVMWRLRALDARRAAGGEAGRTEGSTS